MTESDIPNSWRSQGDVPAVNPADLKAVRAFSREVQAATGGQGSIIEPALYQRACSPGADVEAVWYRASMLGLLEMLPTVDPQMFPESPLTPWTHNGELDDAVLQVAATFPMKRMGVGVVHEGLPFDVEEFLKQVGARK
jgi:hypothetical protein